MATNNAIDAPLPLTVPNGGSGRATSTTAYGTLCAGTTATGVQQTVAPGTAGNVLTSNGASALPSYQAPAGGTSGLTWLGSVTASASSTVAFANLLTSTYDNYLVVFENYVPSTTAGLEMQIGTGATPTYQATSYSGRAITTSTSAGPTAGTAATTYLDMSGGAQIASTATGGGYLNVMNANSTNQQALFSMMNFTGTAQRWTSQSYSVWNGGIVLTSMQFLQSTGTLTTGTFKLYGYTN